MITFGQHVAIILAAQQHKSTHQPEHQQDQPNQHDISPGNANVLLGGLMISSMALFLLWMCYCCRWKDNKFDATVRADQQPYWIDINSNTYYEALQWSINQGYSGIFRESSWSPEPTLEMPPRYETVITPPPGYDDVTRENYNNKEAILNITENNKLNTI